MVTPHSSVDLSLSQLRCFLTVVEAGSFAEAGRRLGLTTSAISKTIARFEAAHRVKLLHRSTHALSPTEEGRALIASARAAMHALEDVNASLATPRDGAGGWVRIAAPVAFQRHCLVPLFSAFRQAHPDIRLDLRASNDLVDLAADGIDLAIRSGPLDAVPGHVQQPWFSFPWVICAAPGYLAGHAEPQTPEMLRDHVLLGFRATHDGLVRPWHFRDPADGAAVRYGPDPSLIVDDGASGWQATLDGVGISCSPLFLAAPALRSGQVVELLRPWRPAQVPVSILRRETRLTPARVTQVIAFLKANAPDLTTG